MSLAPLSSSVAGHCETSEDEKETGAQLHKKGETAPQNLEQGTGYLPRASDLAKTSCQIASEGMDSGSQCQASSMLQSAKQQGRSALSVTQSKLDGERRPPAKQRQHKRVGLHCDQHVGVP